MARELKAKELALEGALVVFLAVALVGIWAGAEQHVAVFRALLAGIAVAFVGRLPARVLLAAFDAHKREQEAKETPVEPQAPAHERRAA